MTRTYRLLSEQEETEGTGKTLKMVDTRGRMRAVLMLSTGEGPKNFPTRF